MLGQACQKGEAQSTYGTGAFIFSIQSLEGSIASRWLGDNLGIISIASEIEELAAKVDSSGGVYFVLAFNGLFAPWWHDDARGAKDVLVSMHKDAGEKGEVKNEKGEFLLTVDGSETITNLLMQIQADLLRNPVVRPADIETTAIGAAYATRLAVGI
ncbi:hypothetical protein PVL29_012044 [Vitis rotundifolia]|uniref:Uncharacterized protein n=1 Tax=Vitis rotundifolia TaxID=103349 RepID=A0AA38ZRN1_VITRO|nr:hypothetical protein PVL29_012044 [Vitis rotundifolia]